MGSTHGGYDWIGPQETKPFRALGWGVFGDVSRRSDVQHETYRLRRSQAEDMRVMGNGLGGRQGRHSK